MLAQPAYVVAELERLLKARHFLFRRVVQGEPEQLSLIEPLKRGRPILDLFGLVYVEHEGCEHLPNVSRNHCLSLYAVQSGSQRTLARRGLGSPADLRSSSRATTAWLRATARRGTCSLNLCAGFLTGRFRVLEALITRRPLEHGCAAL